MKDLLRISITGIAVAMLMGAGVLWHEPEKPQPTSEEISWNEFCKARGYDNTTTDEEVINEFLDTWRGSVEEERAFNNLPALEE